MFATVLAAIICDYRNEDASACVQREIEPMLTLIA